MTMASMCWSVVVMLFISGLLVNAAVDMSSHKSILVDFHNHHRREVASSNMLKLRWDNEVAKFAGDWIEWCTSDNHGGKFGENVFSSSSLPPDTEFIQHTIASWYGEGDGIANNGEDCRTSCNYTQMMWAQSEKIGCAMKRCKYFLRDGFVENDVSALVCFYWPRGNREGHRSYRPGLPCSECPEGTKCDNGLCSGHLENEKSLVNILKRMHNQVTSPEQRMKEADAASGASNNGTKTRRRHRRQLGGMAGLDRYTIESAHNVLRRQANIGSIRWDNHLERWARYVIRCNIEYPGPRSMYTNFAKVPRGDPIHYAVYDWRNEGPDVRKPLRYGCRTPNDREQCNHFTNLMQNRVRQLGCASRDCNGPKRLVCIYSY